MHERLASLGVAGRWQVTARSKAATRAEARASSEALSPVTKIRSTTRNSNGVGVSYTRVSPLKVALSTLLPPTFPRRHRKYNRRSRPLTPRRWDKDRAPLCAATAFSGERTQGSGAPGRGFIGLAWMVTSLPAA